MRRAVALNANARLEGRALRRVHVHGWLMGITRLKLNDFDLPT